MRVRNAQGTPSNEVDTSSHRGERLTPPTFARAASSVRPGFTFVL